MKGKGKLIFASDFKMTVEEFLGIWDFFPVISCLLKAIINSNFFVSLELSFNQPIF